MQKTTGHYHLKITFIILMLLVGVCHAAADSNAEKPTPEKPTKGTHVYDEDPRFKFRVKYDENVSFKDYAAMLVAVRDNDTKTVIELLDKGVKADRIFHRRFGSVLQYAATYGQNVAMVKLFLERGADVNLYANYGQPPPLLNHLLTIAFNKQTLFERKDVSEEKKVKYKAAMNDYIKMAHLFIDHGVDPEKLYGTFYERNPEKNSSHEKYNILDLAAALPDASLVKRLIALGVDVNAKDSSRRPIGTAITHFKNNNFETLNALLAAGASPMETYKGKQRLMSGTYRSESLVLYFMEQGYDYKGRNVLKVAASRGWNTVLTKLIAQGADVNIKYQDDGRILTESVLAYSVEYSDDIETVRLLLNAGADICYSVYIKRHNKYSKTAYDYTIKKNKPEIKALFDQYLKGKPCKTSTVKENQ